MGLHLIPCSLGLYSATLVDNHWPTAGLRVNSSFLKAGIRSNPLFLLEGITILPSTPSAGCDTFRASSLHQPRQFYTRAAFDA